MHQMLHQIHRRLRKIIRHPKQYSKHMPAFRTVIPPFQIKLTACIWIQGLRHYTMRLIQYSGNPVPVSILNYILDRMPKFKILALQDMTLHPCHIPYVIEQFLQFEEKEKPSFPLLLFSAFLDHAPPPPEAYVGLTGRDRL